MHPVSRAGMAAQRAVQFPGVDQDINPTAIGRTVHLLYQPFSEVINRTHGGLATECYDAKRQAASVMRSIRFNSEPIRQRPPSRPLLSPIGTFGHAGMSATRSLSDAKRASSRLDRHARSSATMIPLALLRSILCGMCPTGHVIKLPAECRIVQWN